MRHTAQQRQTKTRSIQRSVQILLTVSGIVFLLAGIVLAASGASVGGALGSVSDRFDDSAQPADGGDSTDDGSADGGNATDGTGSGNDTAGGSANETDGTGGGEADDGGGETDGGDGTDTGGDQRHALTATVETQSGDPIDNATVTVDPGSASSTSKSVDGSGEAEFSLENGEYTVTANAGGYQSTEATVRVDGSNETVTLTLEQQNTGGGSGSNGSDEGPHTLAVTVVDGNGTALSNATVELQDGSGLFASSETKDVNNRGTASFERENGEYTVIADADGYRSKEATVRIDGSDEAIRLTLTPANG